MDVAFALVVLLIASVAAFGVAALVLVVRLVVAPAPFERAES
ncbi:MAG TPA: hypothetical protein VF635_10695 [Propionibacteriaceae bacterium]